MSNSTPQSIPATSETAGTSAAWYFHSGLIALLLFFFAPVGIILMWLQKPRSRFLGGTFTRVALTLFFGGIWLAVMNGGQRDQQASQVRRTDVSASAASAPDEKPPVAPSIPLPPSQSAFIEAVEDAKSPYRDAANELKKSAVRTARGRHIRAALGGKRGVSQWLGNISGMGTTGDGKAWLQVTLEGTEIELKTWNNGLSDIGDDTLIAQESPLFGRIAEFGKGTPVLVSGTFAASDSTDFAKESSMSEAGSMLRPEFIIRFTDVRAR